MFFIFNKQKIYSYLVAASTVIILFILSFFFTNSNVDILETTSNINTLTPIYNVETARKRISLSINIEESADDIDKILNVLKACNVKTTFFVTGTFAEKYPNKIKQIEEAGHKL